MFHLVVTHEFGGNAIGDRITDPGKVAAALSTNPHSVVRIIAPDAPTPEPVPDTEHPAAE